MAEINLLPQEYRLQQQAKKRQRSCLVVFFILLIFFCGHLLGLVGKVQFYRRELADLQQQLASLEAELAVFAELEEREELIEEGRELYKQLVQGDLPWSLILREMEGAARLGIHLDQLHIDSEGRLIVLGQAAELASIASLFTYLAQSPGLDGIDIDYVRQGNEGQWLFSLQGWVRQVGGEL